MGFDFTQGGWRHLPLLCLHHHSGVSSLVQVPGLQVSAKGPYDILTVAKNDCVSSAVIIYSIINTGAVTTILMTCRFGTIPSNHHDIAIVSARGSSAITFEVIPSLAIVASIVRTVV